MINIAYFVSPHGFGHAARACAVMCALQKINPALHFHIFTHVPAWFFADALSDGFSYHHCLSDIGLHQTSSLSEDLLETIKKLDQYYPLKNSLINQLSRQLLANHCQLAICDIAPVGIMAAKAAGIKSILVENFTWDWIYAGYQPQCPAFTRFIPVLKAYFQAADYHIQTMPVCQPDASASLVVPPVHRETKQPSAEIRKRLNISDEQKLILVTMGGVKETLPVTGRFSEYPAYFFIIPGSTPELDQQGNTLFLPYHSVYYHPDLVAASDLVIGKTGYSTLAEVFHAGIPFGFINRKHFRESDVMHHFIINNMPGFEILADDFIKGDWLSRLADYLMTPIKKPSLPNGADSIAQFVSNLL